MKHTPYRINSLEPNQVFVFGANEGGRHGAGAALTAKELFGAQPGVGNGIQGRSYGIPTKDRKFNRLELDKIKLYVEEFLQFARRNEGMEFMLTAIGCGLAGNDPKKIAPMFVKHPDNVILPLEFYQILYPSKRLL